MAEQDRPSRPGRGGPARGGGGRGRPGERSGRPSSSRGDSRGDSRGRSGGRDGSSDRRGGPGGRDGRSSRSADRAAYREQRTAEQAAYDGPSIPEDVSARELDPSVTSQLRGLPEKLAARVARHLAAAQRVVEEDPETAYLHTKAARARAARIAVVREAHGEAAYAAGHYDEALADLRAAKRMNGATAYIPIMADCHRALGQAQQALKLAQSPSVARFAPAAKAEMTLVEAGARRDLGQLDAALRTLEQAPLMSKSREPWVTRLRYAYADTLLEAGRHEEALTWFHRAHAIDAEQITDAAERAAELESRNS